MSESYVSATSTGPAADQSGKADTAKQEATELKDTAKEQTKNVASTAKEEAKSVGREAKYQAKDLYAQGKRQLSDQAGTQQQRVAGGLRSASDQLDSMAGSSDGDSVASDVVRNVSQRLGSAASFLENRDPADLLDEVKNYARRRPAVFIGGALVVGVIVGRLTRALAANARDDSTGASSGGTGDYAGLTGPDTVDPAYPTDYTSADTGYADSLSSDPVDGTRGGTYATGVGAGGLAAGGLGADATDDADYVIPGGAANVVEEDIVVTDEDTPLYTQTAASDDVFGEGDDVQRGSL